MITCILRPAGNNSSFLNLTLLMLEDQIQSDTALTRHLINEMIQINKPTTQVQDDLLLKECSMNPEINDLNNCMKNKEHSQMIRLALIKQ